MIGQCFAARVLPVKKKRERIDIIEHARVVLEWPLMIYISVEI